MSLRRRIFLLSGMVALAALGIHLWSSTSPPGVVISHSPIWTLRFIGSPSLAVLPNGHYAASHDFFGPWSNEKKEGITKVFLSKDRGQTWQEQSMVKGAFWSALFAHRDALYLIGPEKQGGDILVRRSLDEGKTWTVPADEMTGRIFRGKYGAAPTPPVIHDGRLWKTLGRRLLSAPVDADLLQAASWTMLTAKREGNAEIGGQPYFWGEGGAIVAPDGRVRTIAKVSYYTPGEDHAALIDYGTHGEGQKLQLVEMPGARLKFTARFDPVSQLYWALTSYLPPEDFGPRTNLRRNTIGLVSSTDLQTWTLRSVLLHHADIARHGFQYIDWDIEGDDIIAISRTAWPDYRGGPPRQHDANYLTFHRFPEFREMSLP